MLVGGIGRVKNEGGMGVNEFGNFANENKYQTGNRLLGYIGSRCREYVCLDGGLCSSVGHVHDCQ